MIYLFNQTETLIDIVAEDSLIEFTHTIELNQFEQAEFEIPVDYSPEVIDQSQFFGFFSADGSFKMQRIIDKLYDTNLTVQGIDKAESDLDAFIIEDKRPQGTADQALTTALAGTGYQLGEYRNLTAQRKNSFYYISARAALVKIIEEYACEFRIRYTFVENKVSGRYIDLYQRMGRATGHQFEYGTNILSVTYEENADDVVTALIGLGKGEETDSGGYGRRIQFSDVVWLKSKGDPVDKPAGQNYVSDEASRASYGLHQNGVIKHRFGVFVDEQIEDPTELLKATWQELQKLSVPIATFKANLLDMTDAIGTEIWVGDSVAVIRDQIGIALEARIHKIVIDKLNNNRSSVELGDYQTLKSKDRSSRKSQIESVLGSGLTQFADDFNRYLASELARHSAETSEQIRINSLEIDNAQERAELNAERFANSLSLVIKDRINATVEKADTATALAEEALAKFKDASNQLDKTQEAVYSIVGDNGQWNYSKNRLNIKGQAEDRVTSNQVTIALEDREKTFIHNGEGFSVGNDYTFSYANARFVERPHSRLNLIFTEE